MSKLLLTLAGIILILIAGIVVLKRSAMAPPTSVQNHNTVSKEKRGSGNPVPFVLNVPDGYHVSLFASDVPGARDEQFSPGGTLLISSPNSGSIIALPDKNNDGIADEKRTVLSGLDLPHGMAFYQGKLFVAQVDKVVRYSWDEARLTATFDKILFELPSGPDHNKRTLEITPDGTLYVSVGSTCNVCEESNPKFATIMVSNADGDNPHVFATGLRNAAFLAINPATGQLWATEMGRDYLGDNAPPDEINIIQSGNNYGWPYCYGDKIYDRSFGLKAPEYCSNTQAPIFTIPAHSAPLGLAFIPSSFSPEMQGDLLVAYHGSWNRSVPTGYKIVRMHVKGSAITGVEDFLTGFRSSGRVQGRPVDLAFDKSGELFVSDDKAGAIYRISPQ